MTGEIGILNVGLGDTKLSFDPKKPAERERAAKAVTEMLERGYAILVQVGEQNGKPLYQRAESFDPQTCEYLIVGVPEEPASVTSVGEMAVSNEVVTPKRRGRKPKYDRLPAEKTRATAIARSAGG